MGDLLLCSCHRRGRLITPRIGGVSGEDVSSSWNLTIVQPLNIEKKKKGGGELGEEIEDGVEFGGDKSRRELSRKRLMGVNRGSTAVRRET